MVHAVSRCVRRAWLCGRDPYDGRDYQHRRGWVRDRVRELAGVFAIEVCAYAIMSNHSHLVLWCRPSVAGGWSAEEVARRWLRLFGRRDAGLEEKVRELAGDARRVAVCRGRLGSVSWFMRCLNERIARRANAEDGCTGRFWEGRFKCQVLEDEGALVACMAYVDLNPVRAKVAGSLEGSVFTSVHDRLAGRQGRAALAALAGGQGVGAGQAGGEAAAGVAGKKPGQAGRAPGAGAPPRRAKALEAARVAAQADAWLCRMDDADGGGSGRPTVLGIGTDGYLALVDWTGRNLAKGRRGALPAGRWYEAQGSVKTETGVGIAVAGRGRSRAMSVGRGQSAWGAGRRAIVAIEAEPLPRWGG